MTCRLQLRITAQIVLQICYRTRDQKRERIEKGDSSLLNRPDPSCFIYNLSLLVVHSDRSLQHKFLSNLWPGLFKRVLMQLYYQRTCRSFSLQSLYPTAINNPRDIWPVRPSGFPYTKPGWAHIVIWTGLIHPVQLWTGLVHLSGLADLTSADWYPTLALKLVVYVSYPPSMLQ